MFGALTLINVNSGTDYTADAVVLANFYQSGSNYHPSTETLPDLTQATPPVSAIQAPNGMLYESTWTAGTADAVSAVLMHGSIMNEYVLDSATKSGTDWVITLPTKRYYVSTGTGNAPRLFQRNFNMSAASCDDFSASIWDREERVPFSGIIIEPGPLPPAAPNIFCWSANVISFNFSEVLGSVNITRLGYIDTPFQNGWLDFGFPTDIVGAAPNVHRLVNAGATTVSGKGQMTTGNTVTYVGLPTIGFAVVSFANGTLVTGSPPANVLSNYGGNFVHKTNTTIQ